MKWLLLVLTLGARLLLAAELSFYSPTRYAYVVGSALPAIAIVDLEAGRQIANLRIPVNAKVFASSTDSPYLAFSDKVDYAFYILDLKKSAIERVITPSAVYRIVFIPNSSRIALVLQKRIALYDRISKKLIVVPKEFQDLYTRFHTIFSVYSQTFWVTQERTPKIYRYSFSDSQPHWQTIDIGDSRGFGAGAPSYEDQLVAFNTYYADEGLLYFTKTGQVWRTGPMYNSRPLDEPMVPPYIDNDTRHVVFGDGLGDIRMFDLKEHKVSAMKVPFAPSQFRTGWMNSLLIIGGYEHLGIYPFDDFRHGTLYTFGHNENVSDMWVSGDGKLLLWGTTRSNLLRRYDLKRRLRLPDIPIQGVAQIAHIRMTTANTICY